MRSAFKTSGGQSLSVRYNQGDVDFPIVAASAAADAGNWLVIGPGTQVMIKDDNAEHLRDAVRTAANPIHMVKDRGVYWLEVERATHEQSAPLCAARPAAK
eukprot:556316-Karenia_brevis.AAC.1